MVYLVFFLLLLGLLLGPNLWVKNVLKRYSQPREDLPGTGGELAHHLVKGFKLATDVKSDGLPDRFDPTTNTVFLTADNMQGKSLTAVATAAHEVSHALQFAQQDSRLENRTRMVLAAQYFEKAAQFSLVFIPVFTLVPGLVVFSKILLFPVILSIFMSTIVHMLTLPVELDASFNKALPILKEGNYLSEKDLTIARKILRACALTYVSSAAVSVLNLSRLLRILRR